MSARMLQGKLCAVAAAAVFTSGAQAQLDELLLIDLSVPNQITIMATSGLSAATISGGDTTGVYMENFYQAAGGALNETLVSGNLTNVGSPSDNSPDLFRAGSGSDTGLNIWSWSPDVTVTFTAGTQAFSGSGTWTLEADDYADMLNNNPVGNLYFPADDAGDLSTATLIGTYRVIPAPGAATLLGLGLGLGAVRRRR